MASQWKTVLGRLLHFTKWIPTSSKILYPFWLSAQLDVVDESAVFSHLPAAFDGLVIAYCSDIHYGPFFGKKRAEDLARKMAEAGVRRIIFTDIARDGMLDTEEERFLSGFEKLTDFVGNIAYTESVSGVAIETILHSAAIDGNDVAFLKDLA